ncbi:MAG: cytoplasmic protein [Candidatus Firestonebacteria bacterium RIFOXYC2_FULL_39_67]|nr:MAG: cytoplasmic protein [Candidatus Firestonebacteria bacterium RIFOXYD2_FULL_39_29]OGF56206.1 MAG: cytoplasmic protein [Candidatus Firestonebacteria bacterium RIFOXYC2_FULL_39_67]OGF57285.1 MAG: cytoplasmic protein [Candidatus Firestonebacteria bacterium RifOxyC12_full_39_7]
MKDTVIQGKFNFEDMVQALCSVDQSLSQQTVKAININLTMRNWIIGMYISEYERVGTDRAKYGDLLMDTLSEKLINNGLSRCDRRELYRYCKFYQIYPQIVESLTPQFVPEMKLIPVKKQKKMESVTPQLMIPVKNLIEKLSFTHFAELIEIDDVSKRLYYEHECIRGNWSVRELERQINSLYYERLGLSTNKKKLVGLVSKKAEQNKPELVIRDPYVFEFLGLKPKEVVKESDLESALLDKLQEFLLELGYGFCFEARQKRINIGGEYCFVDLVFYHRVLKCHVLVELKADKFKHENVSQLNTYVNWYKKCEMTKGDNPPIGILLCTQKNHEMVEFALAGMDNKLFVKKYQLELPKKKEITKFLKGK